MYYSTKILGSKNQKKNLCRGPSLALGKGDLCRGLGQWPSAKKLKKNKKSLPSVWRRALGKDWPQWPSWPIRPYLLRANLPRARPSAKIYFAEGRLFAEGQALGKGFFAEGSWGWPSAKTPFAECPRYSPRQSQKPSAKRTSPVVRFRILKSHQYIHIFDM